VCHTLFLLRCIYKESNEIPDLSSFSLLAVRLLRPSQSSLRSFVWVSGGAFTRQPMSSQSRT